jgi:hypothetical protein
MKTIKVTPDEYNRCKEAVKSWYSRQKTGNYGKGILKDPDFIGLLGEVGVAKLLNWEVDYKPHKYGNRWDFEVDGKIDVKATTNTYRKKWYVQRINEDGVINPHSEAVDIYICVEIQDSGEDAEINVVGWCIKDDIPPVVYSSPVRNCNHKNWEITKKILKPIEITKAYKKATQNESDSNSNSET